MRETPVPYGPLRLARGGRTWQEVLCSIGPCRAGFQPAWCSLAPWGHGAQLGAGLSEDLSHRLCLEAPGVCPGSGLAVLAGVISGAGPHMWP